jgi:hypothetical protein
MGTTVLERVDHPSMADEGETMALDGVRPAFAFLEVFGTGDRVIGHSEHR